MSIGNFFQRSPAHAEFGAEPSHPMRPAFTALEPDLDPYGTTEEDAFDVTRTPWGNIGPRAPWEPLP